jgi:hypothetical protein
MEVMVIPSLVAVAGAALALILAVSGCDSAPCDGRAATLSLSCIPALKYHGHLYTQFHNVIPELLNKGRPLHGVLVPGCNDTGTGRCMTREPDRPARAWTIRHVRPSVAFLVPSRSGREVFLRGLEQSPQLPSPIMRMLRQAQTKNGS